MRARETFHSFGRTVTVSITSTPVPPVHVMLVASLPIGLVYADCAIDEDEMKCMTPDEFAERVAGPLGRALKAGYASWVVAGSQFAAEDARARKQVM